MAAAKCGERIGSKPPYGYKKDPNDPKRIIPNEDTAPIVRRIFALCASGLGPSKIARILKQDKILKPTSSEYQASGAEHAHLNTNKPFDWCGRTVVGVLEHEEYIGTTVNTHKDECTPHTIKVMALHQIVLVEIQRVTAEAKEHTEQFLQRVMDKHQSQLKSELSAKTRELKRTQKRLVDLDTLFRKAFKQLHWKKTCPKHSLRH
nr:recombinase family protein [uncultured Bacillus sp.]